MTTVHDMSMLSLPSKFLYKSTHSTQYTGTNIGILASQSRSHYVAVVIWALECNVQLLEEMKFCVPARVACLTGLGCCRGFLRKARSSPHVRHHFL